MIDPSRRPCGFKIGDEHVVPALLRTDFAMFLRRAFEEVGGGRAYQHNWHIDAIEYQLDRVQRGETRRLILTMPPRHLKSVTVSTAWVAWMLGKDPSRRFVCISYGYDLAEKHARDCLRIMSTEWYKRAFPNVRLTRRSVLDFETNAGGGRLSTSFGGAITGRGGDIIIIDDPMKADDALSEVRREYVVGWYDSTIISRLDGQGESSIIVVMQRLHEGDLVGALQRRGNWDELRLSALATEDELIPLSLGRFHQRRAGSALHPARLSRAMLEERRAEDPYVFAAQYQQTPVAKVGAFVQAQWFGTYDDPPQTGIIVQSWDTATKTTVRSDWSVGITASYYQGRYYILDVFRKRVEFGELQRSLYGLCRQYRVTRLLIEDAASGQQLIQELRRDPPYDVVLPIPVHPSVEKIVRFEAQASRIEAGTVILPRTAPWIADFVAELVGFPGALHDDQADALAQMLAHSPPEAPMSGAGPELMDLYGDYEGDEDDYFAAWE